MNDTCKSCGDAAFLIDDQLCELCFEDMMDEAMFGDDDREEHNPHQLRGFGPDYWKNDAGEWCCG